MSSIICCHFSGVMDISFGISSVCDALKAFCDAVSVIL